MRFKSFKIGKTDEKPEEKEGQEETATVSEITDMEEKMASKTKKLKDAEQQLKGLTDSAKGSEVEDDETTGPHGPLIELTVEPGDDLMDLETEAELNTLMDTEAKDNEKDINVVEVLNKDNIKDADKTAEKPADEAQKNEKTEQGNGAKSDKETTPDIAPKEGSDSFNNLFSDEEEEVNPLVNLINSLPEVSAQELIDELEEIKQLIKERQQG